MGKAQSNKCRIWRMTLDALCKSAQTSKRGVPNSVYFPISPLFVPPSFIKELVGCTFASLSPSLPMQSVLHLQTPLRSEVRPLEETQGKIQSG